MGAFISSLRWWRLSHRGIHEHLMHAKILTAVGGMLYYPRARQAQRQLHLLHLNKACFQSMRCLDLLFQQMQNTLLSSPN